MTIQLSTRIYETTLLRQSRHAATKPRLLSSDLLNEIQNEIPLKIIEPIRLNYTENYITL